MGKKADALKAQLDAKDAEILALKTNMRAWEIALHTANVNNLNAEIDRQRYRRREMGFLAIPPSKGIDDDQG